MTVVMQKIFRSKEFWIITALTLVGAGLRFWQLGEPAEVVFDETYYAKWGQDYLQGESFFDVHPPLGKLLIAVGVYLFGSNPEAGIGAIGWRFMPALFGVAVVPLTYVVAKKLFATTEDRSMKYEVWNEEKNVVHNSLSIIHNSATRIALFAALFVLLDGLLLVQSRTALLDSFQITFALAAVASFLAFRDAATSKRAGWWLVVTGFFLGCLIAAKWTGVAIVGLIWLFYLLWYRSSPRVPLLVAFVSLLVLPAAIYVASFVFNERTMDFWPYLLDWHKQTWNFHHTLTADHPYQSQWWSWLYLARPVWYYFNDDTGAVRGILALGNPILWWTAIPALATALWVTRRKLETGLGLALLAVLAFYLPWVIISRTQFQYYLAPATPFLMIILAWWLVRLRPWVAPTIATLAIAIFAFYYPLLIGTPVSNNFYRPHIWFRSWI